MINVDFINIDNARLIGRLLPFWARGRWISLFMMAILSPIISVHNAFKVWALKQYVSCFITAQKASLEWYLKYCLKSRFLDEDDSFVVDHGNSSPLSCFSSEIWENSGYWDNGLLWDDKEYIEQRELVKIAAPEIVDTVSYNHEDYERDIRNILSKFMINFDKISITIAGKDKTT